MTNPTTVLVSNDGYVADMAALKASTTGFTILGSQKQTVTASGATGVANEPFIFIVSKDAEGLLKYSPAIYKNNLKRIESAPYIASIPQTAQVVFPAPNGSTMNYSGKEYVVRIVYKDIYGHAGQFTQTYRVNGDYIKFTGSAPTATDLAAAMTAAINRQDEYSIRQHTIARVEASASGNTMTITAKPRTDVTGIYSINEYAQVNFEVTAWVAIENSHLNNVYTPISAETGGKVIQAPEAGAQSMLVGKGNYMLVRDREKVGVAYKGGLNAKAWPAQFNSTSWHTFTTNPALTYQTLTIISEADYMSDNRFPRSTQYTTELYVATGEDNGKDILNAFIDASKTGYIVANTAANGTVSMSNAIA